jgi:thioredoxin-related protein
MPSDSYIVLLFEKLSNSCILISIYKMETRQSAQLDQSPRDTSDANVVDLEIEENEVIDDQEESQYKLNEDELCQVLKVNSIISIEYMRISPKEASRFDNPLCQMIYIALV